MKSLLLFLARIEERKLHLFPRKGVISPSDCARSAFATPGKGTLFRTSLPPKVALNALLIYPNKATLQGIFAMQLNGPKALTGLEYKVTQQLEEPLTQNLLFHSSYSSLKNLIVKYVTKWITPNSNTIDAKYLP